MCGPLSLWPDHRPWPRRARREAELWEHVNYIGLLNPYKNPARGLSVLFCVNGKIGSERPSNTSKITQLGRRKGQGSSTHFVCVGGPKPPNAMSSLHYPCLLSRRPEAHLFPEAWKQVARCLPAGPGPKWSPQGSDALSPCSDLGQVF